MHVIDVDPEVLRQSAEAAAHAYEQTIIHIDKEIEGDIPPLMETLTPEGPYGYTIMPEVHPDGSVRLPIITTREGIHEAYKMVRGFSWLNAVVPLTEIRGEWYTFQDNISRATVKETGEYGEHQTLGLFPSAKGTGITGELIWVRVPRSALGIGAQPSAGSDDELKVREEVLQMHEAYVQALQKEDVDGILATLRDEAQSAIRDYANETGTINNLDGKDAHRAYYESFFEKFGIRSVQILHRVFETWFAFAELRLTVSPRADSARTLAFHTAEFHIPANDGLFIARIGHGTDPA